MASSPEAKPHVPAYRSSIGEAEKGQALGRAESFGAGASAEVHHQKPFTTFTAIGLGYSITNTATGVILTVAATTPFGGSPLFFWGFLLIAAIALCIATTLGEFCSMWPHPGGQYVWVAQLSPERPRRFLSYMTAIISWASVVCISASCALAASTTLFQMISFTHPELEVKPWMLFVTFEVLNMLIFGLNCFEFLLPLIGKFLIFFTVTMIAIIFIALFAADTGTNSGQDFFFNYYNVSGWSNGIAFLIGINGLNWCFSCLDAATHLADEIPQPQKNIPKALIWTILVGAATGLLIIFALFFTAKDLTTETNSLLIFFNVIHHNKNAALALEALVFVSAYGSLIGIHTWQSRIAWALSRDKGFPFHSYLSRLAPAPFSTPIWAHLWSSCWTGLCGCLYLGSQTAFSSFIAGGIILQYATYCLPIALLLWRGRSRAPHGPFWFPKIGLFCNIVTVIWFLVTLVFYCFPYFLPVQADQMNYVSAVLFVIIMYALIYWFTYGHKHYRLPRNLLVSTSHVAGD
ncbi:hypothetical protein MRS44_013045 [Fusarium solani]|uniref:uncharacterized protein n=1 Tax=Fusarium solani TaxID=169388 RepID=UPI002314CEDF|nr:hypothetical protein MRS44_013045 [Fusarium solani]KAJ4209654.1 hypothetical protein NW759_013301 [Fusarium solani]